MGGLGTEPSVRFSAKPLVRGAKHSWSWNNLAFVHSMEAANVHFCKIWKHKEMSRAHSFLQKILANSEGQFAKFHGLPRQNHTNSTAHHSLLFESKLSYVLFRNFCRWRLSTCSVMLQRTKKLSIFSFLLKVQLSCVLFALYNFAVLQ